MLLLLTSDEKCVLAIFYPVVVVLVLVLVVVLLEVEVVVVLVEVVVLVLVVVEVEVEVKTGPPSQLLPVQRITVLSVEFQYSSPISGLTGSVV